MTAQVRIRTLQRINEAQCHLFRRLVRLCVRFETFAGESSQVGKIGGVGGYALRGRRAGNHQPPQLEPILILANQFPDVLAAGAVATFRDLFVNERFQRVRKGDIHGAHSHSLGGLPKFGKMGVAAVH
ncbi:hypothetical protein G6F65_018633 [Rhizopus arrhizus]|nr:hypothetical protein G6F65_018633 [Rhizopus arrhizus]